VDRVVEGTAGPDCKCAYQRYHQSGLNCQLKKAGNTHLGIVLFVALPSRLIANQEVFGQQVDEFSV
jgi:hypothetical protein